MCSHHWLVLYFGVLILKTWLLFFCLILIRFVGVLAKSTVCVLTLGFLILMRLILGDVLISLTRWDMRFYWLFKSFGVFIVVVIVARNGLFSLELLLLIWNLRVALDNLANIVAVIRMKRH